MEAALYDPVLGYYARAARRSGRAGDFFTSVDLGPLFGKLLAVQVAEMADHLGSSTEPFTLADAGASDGRLSQAMLAGLELSSPHIAARTRLLLVERSAVARLAQSRVLSPWPDHASCSEELPDSIHGVIVANELLDAMPVHQVVMTTDGLREVYVDLAGTG